MKFTVAIIVGVLVELFKWMVTTDALKSTAENSSPDIALRKRLVDRVRSRRMP